MRSREKINLPLRNEVFMSMENKKNKGKNLYEGMNLSGFITSSYHLNRLEIFNKSTFLTLLVRSIAQSNVIVIDIIFIGNSIIVVFKMPHGIRPSYSIRVFLLVWPVLSLQVFKTIASKEDHKKNPES